MGRRCSCQKYSANCIVSCPLHCALRSMCAQQSPVSLVGEASSLGPLNFMSTFLILNKIKLPQDWELLTFSSRRAIMKREPLRGGKVTLGKSETSVLFSRLTCPGNIPHSGFVSTNHWLCCCSGVPTALYLAELDTGWPVVDRQFCYKGGWRKHEVDLSFILCISGNSV